MRVYLKFLRLFMVLIVGVFFLVGSGSSGGDDKGSTSIVIESSEKFISGYVVDDPIENANISLFSIEGKLLEENITTDNQGYFEIKVDDAPDEYIVYSSGGQMNGTTFDGELFAFCQSSTCNLTPLSTVTYQYANSMLTGTFTEKYAKAQKTITEYLGVSDDDIHKISGVSSFKFDEFRKLAKSDGFAVVIGGLVNDLVDGYIDEENNQKLFSSYLARVELPLPSEIETLKDEDGEDVTLTVHGADGADHSKGFLIDVVATQKATVVNDDAQEVEEDQTVFLGFNLGEYKGKLNSETTVLAKLFMSDMSLALLPNDTKGSLVKQLKAENSELYNQTINLYKFIVKEGTFYEPLFDEKFDLLVGKAQVLVTKTAKKSTALNKIQAKQTSFRKDVLLYSNYRKTNRMYATDKHVKKTLSPYLNIDYDDQNHSFSVKNRLPIFFGIRESKSDYEWYENFTVPLIQPAQGGALGIKLSEYKDLVTLVDWTTGAKLIAKTTFYGELLSPKLFPSASETVEGYQEFEIFKNGLDMPTIRNVGLGVTSVVKFLSGSGVSKTFNKAIQNISKGLDTTKKVLGYAQSGVDIADGFFQVLYLITDEAIKNKDDLNLTNMQVKSLVGKSVFFKKMYNTVQREKETISLISSLIPDSASLITKDKKTGFFLTKIEGKDSVKTVKNNISLNIFNLVKKGNLSENDIKNGKLTPNQSIYIIVGGKILGNTIGNFDANSIFDADSKDISTLKKKAKAFKDKWKISIQDFAILELYYLKTKSKKASTKLFNKVSTRLIQSSNDYKHWREAELEYREFLVSGIVTGHIKKLLLDKLSKLLSPANIGKKLASWKRLSVNDAFAFSKDIIIKEIKNSGKAVLKGVIQSAVKQATLIIASGGSAGLIKGAQFVDMANELGGIGYGMFATPSVVPFAIEVDKKGVLTYKHPSMRVKGAINNLIPKDGSENFMILSKHDNDTSPLIITSSNVNSPSKYDLSYKILFENSADNLEGLFASNSNWDGSLAIYADMKIQEYSDDTLKGTLLLKSGRKNNATWFIKPEEASSKVESNQGGSEIDLISILNKQDEGFFQNLWGSTRSTTVSNFSRGIFNESFNYKIYEPKDSPLVGKVTKIQSFERNIFKIANAKDLRKGIKLYRYDNKNNAITNNTGHAIIISFRQNNQDYDYGNKDFYIPTSEYYLANGETKLFPIRVYKSMYQFVNIYVTDAIVKEYGKQKGLFSMESVFDYLKTIKNDFYTKYVVDATKALNSQAYSFVIEIKEESFIDTTPNEEINLVNTDDLLALLKDDNLKSVLYYTTITDRKDKFTNLYPLTQYGVSLYNDDATINFNILKNSNVITTYIPNDIYGGLGLLAGKYKVNDLLNYKLDIVLDEFDRISGVTFTDSNTLSDKKIEFRIGEYIQDPDGVKIILDVVEGKDNIIECFKECKYELFDEKLYIVLSSREKDFLDSDYDGIVDGLDMFPDNSEYQSDSDQDGMPDKWEDKYSLDKNNPDDNATDLNKNNITNLDEFIAGSDPKNHAPTANAGDDQTIKQGVTVTLDASVSSDTEDDIDSLSFVWKEGDDELGTDTIITLNDLSIGTHTITLTVTDSEEASSSDEVVIIITDENTDTINLEDGLIAKYSSNNNHRYYIYHEQLNWTDSKTFCETRNLHLATITSADESTFIDTFIGDLTQTYYWLGGTDKDSEGEWKWITGEEWNYDNWYSGEPNNGGSVGEDYLHLLTRNGQIKWNDIPNQVYDSMGLICEDDNTLNSLSNGLVAHYKFDDPSNLGKDSSGKGNHGTAHGGLGSADGVIGQAGSFDGVDDYIQITPQSDVSAISDFTITVWTYFDYRTDNSGIRHYVFDGHTWSKDAPDNDIFRDGFAIMYDANNNIEEIYNHINIGSGTIYNGQKGVFDLSHKWLQVSFIRKSSELLTYINGKKINLNYVNNNVKDEILNMQHNWFIGTAIGNNQNYHVKDNYSYKGLIDDLRIYNRALNESEIKKLYAMGNPQKIEGKYLKLLTPPLKNKELTFTYNYDGTNCSLDFRDGTRISLDSCTGKITHSFKKEWVYEVELKSDNEIIDTVSVTIANSDNNWIGFVGSLNSYMENNEKTDNIIKNGRLYLAPSLSNESYYWTNYRYIKPSILSSVSGDNFVLEARIKNPSSEGGISCYDPSFRVIGKNGKQAWVTFMSADCTYYSSIGAVDSYDSGGASSSVPTSDLSILGQDFSDWKTIKLEVKNQKVSAYYESKKLYTKTYTGSVDKIYGIVQTFKGSGSMDWVKLYNGDGKLIYSEDFN